MVDGAIDGTGAWTQADMELAELKRQLAANGVLRQYPETQVRDCIAAHPLAPILPSRPPPLASVKQALIADVALPLSCQALQDRRALRPSAQWTAKGVMSAACTNWLSDK